MNDSSAIVRHDQQLVENSDIAVLSTRAFTPMSHARRPKSGALTNLNRPGRAWNFDGAQESVYPLVTRSDSTSLKFLAGLLESAPRLVKLPKAER